MIKVVALTVTHNQDGPTITNEFAEFSSQCER